MTDYSHISLSLTVLSPSGETKKIISFGKEITPQFSGNALEMFVNAEEVFVFDTSGNQNIVSLWKAYGDDIAIATLGIDKGSKVKPQAIIRLLRECVTIPGLKPEELFEVFGFHRVASPCLYPEETAPTLHRAMRTFTSTGVLADIVSARFSGGDREAAIVFAVDATAVPVDEEDTLVRLRTAPVPDFEVDTTEVVIEKPKKDLRSTYYTDTHNPSGYDDEEEEYVVYPQKKRKSNPLVIIILVLIALAAGWAAVKFLPALIPDSDYSRIESTDVTQIALNEVQPEVPVTVPVDTVIPVDKIEVTPVSNPDTVPTVAPEPAAVPEAPAPKPKEDASAEKADLEYLNSNKIWNRTALKSDTYRKLFDLFAAGNISDIANADYFAVPGRCTNRDADKAVTFLWQAYHTDTQHSNVRILKRLAGKNEIDMHTLMEDLAKARSPKPNTTPRPRH